MSGKVVLNILYLAFYKHDLLIKFYLETVIK